MTADPRNTRNDTSEIDAILPMLRRQSQKMLDGRAYSGKLISADESDCTCDFWLHRKPSAQKLPLIIELHGGGFALGDARKGDALREALKGSFDASVIGIDYRLAPEYPFPCAIEDVLSVLGYVTLHSEELGVDLDKIYLLGFSAGASLSIGTCLTISRKRNPEDALPVPAGLILHYPFLDAYAIDTEDWRDQDIAKDMVGAFNTWYAQGHDLKDPMISACYASDEDLRGLPSIYAYPVSGDTLATSCEGLCERLANLDHDVHVSCIDGAYHGYIEDAVDLESYLACSMPQTIAMRPHNFADLAWEVLFTSIEEALRQKRGTYAVPNTGRTELDDLYERYARS